ncbi:hypothetical protein BV22DRAFT_1107414 [Leucogyrophana mollusca]|uniref:Uncharacterized protein n=1 Tax=Leucogyrophana mollusca TaxID=85980 RepID=A0ACB8B8B2_9AGAM|nr:hypothetical protein BV22DRAFT_1107414 [Leucogyrophana mollusca]
MGLYRVYSAHPTLVPPDNTTLNNVCDAPALEAGEHPGAKAAGVLSGLPSSEIGPDELFAPFTNPSCGLLMAWHYSGSNDKSTIELDRLSAFLQDPLFDPKDLPGFNHAREAKLLDNYLKNKANPFREENGWQRSTVRIRFPKERTTWPSETDAPELEIPNVLHRSLSDIITSVFQDDVSTTFHMTPFRQYWKVSEERTIEVFSEAYTSSPMLDAYEEINALPREPGDDLERVVASLMLWSDSTHLTSFGDASMWPFYLFFGNQSKYTRVKPTAPACHHVAYIPTLPDDIQDTYVSMFGTSATSDQRVDSEARRRHVKEARDLIFELGAAVDGTRVKAILDEYSYVPVCAMPVFEHLLDKSHNTILLDLLFELGTWHAYAKLRLHTDDTLTFFDATTISLGQTVRKFQHTICDHYDTRELPQEYAARGRRTSALASKQAQSGHEKNPESKTKRTGPKRKKLNLNTYKYHALGDYPNTIRRMGTTDSYSTQTGELQHRRVKRRYPRTSKNKQTTVQSMSRLEARDRLIGKIMERRERLTAEESARNPNPKRRRLRTSPSDHYHIAESARTSYDLTAWLSELTDDPATVDFIPRLKNHLLSRLRGIAYTGEEPNFTDEDRDSISIAKNQLYEHSLLRVNYTTYDLRREQDSISLRTRPDIMVLSHEEDDARHPYWYARVIRIFHVNVRDYGEDAESSAPQRMNFLFVRWFGRDTAFRAGFSARRLHRVGFMQDYDPDEFGFLDPDQVIRGVHLIPASRNWENYLEPSIARRSEEEDADWSCFYVNMFVDRDMFMRFRGGGIGHKATRGWDDFLQNDGGTKQEQEDDVVLPQADGGNDVEDEEDELEGQEGEREEDDDGGGDEDNDDDDDDDADDDGVGIQADDGEELDDDILAEEGYGVL